MPSKVCEVRCQEYPGDMAARAADFTGAGMQTGVPGSCLRLVNLREI